MSTEEKIDKLCGLLRSIAETAAVTLESQSGDERADLSTITKGLRAIGGKFVAACALGVFDLPPASTPPRADVWPLCIPEIGIEFKRYYSPKVERFIAAWQDKTSKTAHVYELTVKPWGTRWRAYGANDGGMLFDITSASKETCRRAALAAMRAYLIRGHRRVWGKARSAKAARVAPLSPEAELAATVARQKEVE